MFGGRTRSEEEEEEQDEEVGETIENKDEVEEWEKREEQEDKGEGHVSSNVRAPPTRAHDETGWAELS